MVRQTPKAYLFAACAVFALSACNNGAKQYPRDSFAQTQPNLDKVLGDNDSALDKIFTETYKPTVTEGAEGAEAKETKNNGRLSEEENRRRVMNNTKAPIIFGTGAAGITFKTTIEKAHQILSEPQGGEDETGSISYQEGVIVSWKRDKPRTPEQIMVMGGYFGEFVQLSKAFPKKGKVTIKTDFEEEFAVDGGKGVDLLKKIVRAVMDKDEKFDCVAEGICSIEVRGLIVRMTFPSGLIAFSIDRKTLYGAGLLNVVDMGKLDNSLDIILGQVNDKDSGVSIRLGDTWGVARDKIGVDQKAIVMSNHFIKDYTQMGAVVTRTQFKREYVQPADTETLKGLMAIRSYRHPIKFNNQYLAWQKTNDGIDMNFLDESAAAGRTDLIRLGVRGLSNRNTAIQFLDKLGEKVLEKIQEEHGSFSINDEKKLTALAYRPLGNPGDVKATTAVASRSGSQVLVQRLTGLHRSVGQGKIESSTVVYDLNRKTGATAFFEFDMGKSSFSRFSASKLILPTDYLVALTAADPVSAKKHQLLGIDLSKAAVELSDVDLGRKEAGIKLTLADGSTHADHVNLLKPSDELTIVKEDANEGSVEHSLEVTTAEVSSFPDVRFYLSDYTKNPKLVAVETSQFMGGITDICGLKNFKPRRTQSVKSFLQEFEAATEGAKKQAEKEKRSFVCRTASEKDKDGTGEVKSITFSREQVKFIFKNNELSSVIFY